MTIDAGNERLYNARAAIPDHPQIFERWARQSAAAREALAGRAVLDLAFGERPLERLDLFKAGEGAPLHVFVHGGYWQALDKSFFSFLAPAFLDAGISLAVLNYSLCPAVTLDEIEAEIARALVWLAGSGASHGVASSGFQLSGHSAGGHLVAAMFTDDRAAATLASGISISGLFDLAPLVSTSINAKVGLDETSARRNSPAFRPPARDLPLVLCEGELESAAFHWQSDMLAETWTDRLSDIRRFALAGRHHLGAVEELGVAGSRLFATATELARR